ncbi:MAG: class I SAM-dependent methyltransferase [Proteobacteria bacterium]|nr:class I SAM-dependent methyltransferase [Pseudomonadota bacterium]
MLYSEEPVLSGDYVVIQIHQPRTGGTSLRLMLREVFGGDKCFMNYKGELAESDEATRRSLRVVAGHVPYGDHAHFDKPAHYVTVVRDPIERFKSTYAEFLTNSKSPYYELARGGDINRFVGLVLNTDIPGLRQQLHNLQCRFICGEASFERARQFIDDRYYLACAFPDVVDMAEMLRVALGAPAAVLPHVHETDDKLKGLEHLMQLSPASLTLLLASESEDMLLYSYVQKAFSAVRDDAQRRTGSKPVPIEGPVPERIPPKELRFMGEDEAMFLRHGDYLAAAVFEASGLAAGPRRMLDIGCGYGRLAYGLRRAGYDGGYDGFDILARHIGWLNEQFAERKDDSRYRFVHADMFNERYNPDGKPLAALELPFERAAFDCLVSLSVFTHLYEQEVVGYVRYLKQFLAPGGVWITTFFAIPPECSLERQPGTAVYPLVKQVSTNAFIHNPDEPLLVIAYREQFLLELFAREGLEVVRQRKGRWLTADNAVELQDWFVLRLREDRARAPVPQIVPAVNLPVALPMADAVCNICGNTTFGNGPGGRSASTGKAPRCCACEALERHRIVRRVFEALPVGFLNARKGLQFSADPGVLPAWFQHYEVSEYGGQNSLDAQAIDRSDGSYGFISLNHVLESVPDDVRAFGELCRILGDDGVIQVCFGGVMDRATTQELAEPRHEWGTRRLYGRDVPQRFQCVERGISVLAVEEEDPCTGVREVVHFFFKRRGDALRVRNWLQLWSDTVRVLE